MDSAHEISQRIEHKRAQMREEFFGKLFLLGGFLGATDTYKRTMWASVPEIAVQRAAYTLTFRKPLPEEGAGRQLIMAGHEAMLAQWFHRPLKRADIELAREWFSKHAAVRAFPHRVWDEILSQQPG
ncbi:MAG: nicotinamide phosphoribosyltransferase domain-containing protein, partial [Gemmataceae bacterium]|nr:nicotinamide phosphoribosyltransferase domain-containing protein [Gemmataceae bacterium]